MHGFSHVDAANHPRLRSPFLEGASFVPLNFLAVEVCIQGETFLRLLDANAVNEGLSELRRQGNHVVRATEVHFVGSTLLDEGGCYTALYAASDRSYRVAVDLDAGADEVQLEFGLSLTWSHDAGCMLDVHVAKLKA